MDTVQNDGGDGNQDGNDTKDSSPRNVIATFFGIEEIVFFLAFSLGEVCSKI